MFRGTLDPSPTPSCSSTSSGSSTAAGGENCEFLEIALRCPNGTRLAGKFHIEKTPFEVNIYTCQAISNASYTIRLIGSIFQKQGIFNGAIL